jgi:hypothetical protein
MSNFRAVTYTSLLCAGLLAATVPQAKADQWDQRTIFTFSGPVEIPGQVLPPGTYVFKLADSSSDRNIVQVFNQDENHIYGTFNTVPDYRVQPTGRPVITFEERAAGAPAAVRAWFWPGDYYGHEFIYHKARPAALASVNTTPAAPAPTQLAQTTTPAPQPQVTAPAPQPQGEAARAQESAPPAPSQPPAQPAQTLPQTASQWPLLCLIGLLSIGTGSLLGLTGTRRHSANR